MAKPKKSKTKAVKAVGPIANATTGILSELNKPKKPKPPKPIKQIGPALALSGGAAHGDFEVGVVRYLYDKGLVPKIICGTSVGSINALKLAEGEPKGTATADADGHIQGLSGLIAIWKALKFNDDMYTTLSPLAKLETDAAGLAHSLKSSAVAGGIIGGTILGSMLGPLGGALGGLGGASTGAAISALTHINQFKNDIARLLTTRSLANLDPLRKRMNLPASFKTKFVEKSGIALRMVMTALEDGVARLVDEQGTLRDRDNTPTPGAPAYDKQGQAILAQIKQKQHDIQVAEDNAYNHPPSGPKQKPTQGDLSGTLELKADIQKLRAELAKHVIGSKPIKVGLTEAALASSSLPVFFPPQRLGDGKFYVDGGTRMVTPIETAWKCGASVIYGVVASQDPMRVGTDPFSHTDVPSYAPPVNVVDIALRVGAEIEPSEINDSQLLPPNGWPVPVILFRPRYDIHDSLTIDPGLIDIRMDQGWMCGDDVMQAWARDSVNYLDVAERFDDARGTTAIARYRHQIWIAEFAANGRLYRHDGTGSPKPPGVLAPPDILNIHEYVQEVRAMKQTLQQLVQARIAAGGNVPPHAERWWTEWERHSWVPNAPLFPLAEMTVTASPSSPIPFNKPITIRVTATSAGKPVPGAGVFVNDVRVGATGKPITTTFHPGQRETISPEPPHLHQKVLAAPRVMVEAAGFTSTPVPIHFAGVGDPAD
jgi:predicted acylesterase/phospholipase RssA